ncbi:hypothetical protein [Taibaiella soli]|uniref:Uncharacterized protein n=1 Tax=Taibaiella soli TaxID=1649169 RepID=A0A2W2AWL1_9BACT|nr:hypothetical protein [Taibaiella soli]PZF72088.1 hypothetical protein DN068_14210 [Taibaiella soli]
MKLNSGKLLLSGFGLVITLALCYGTAFGQGGGVKLSPRDQYLDSLKRMDADWPLPIWGNRLLKKGFDLQYPFGAMINGFVATQKVVISDLKVGFNDMDPVPLDFIKFGDVKAKAVSTNARLDAWILPFMDLYGIVGKTWTKTEVDITEPFKMNSTANFDGNTLGLGTTIAGGYHRFVTIIDLNHTWTTLENIKGTIQSTMFTPRLGYNFILKNKADMSITVWVGASGMFINRTTEGTIPLSDLTTDASREKLQQIVDGAEDWYQGLKPPQQAVIKQIAQKLIDKMDGLDIKDATVSYSLNKRPTSNWSMNLGAQWQLNHRWQIRSELGFFGGRQSLLLSGNYRWHW